MSPAAMIGALCALLVACGGAHTEASGASLDLIIEATSDDIAVVANGTPISLVPTRKGPRLVADASLGANGGAYGLGTYLDAAHGQNGHPGINVDRTQFPRLMWETPPYGFAGNWVFVIVDSPTTAVGTPTTRGYRMGWTMTLPLNVEGTRFVIAQNANVDSTWKRLGYADDDFDNGEQPGLNRAWHRFYDERGNPAECTTGPQVNVVMVSENYNPVWIRNGKLLGVGLPGMYGPHKSGPSVKMVLWSEHWADGAGGSTATFFDGPWFDYDQYRIVSGQPTIAELKALCQAKMTKFNIPADP